MRKPKPKTLAVPADNAFLRLARHLERLDREVWDKLAKKCRKEAAQYADATPKQRQRIISRLERDIETNHEDVRDACVGLVTEKVLFNLDYENRVAIAEELKRNLREIETTIYTHFPLGTRLVQRLETGCFFKPGSGLWAVKLPLHKAIRTLRHITEKQTPARSVWDDIPKKMKAAIEKYWIWAEKMTHDRKRPLVNRFCKDNGIEEIRNFKGYLDLIRKRKRRGWPNQ